MHCDNDKDHISRVQSNPYARHQFECLGLKLYDDIVSFSLLNCMGAGTAALLKERQFTN